ncbi:cytochrome c2 [soil metagenome]
MKITLSGIAVGIAMLAVTNASADEKKELMAKGQKVYTEYCKTCHQANGQGIPNVYPPLAASDYIKTMPRKTIATEVVNGKNGKVKVNGKEFNGVMTALPAKYTDADVAAVLTYVYNSWGNPGGVFAAKEIAKVRKKK